jgi:hypothetical protein
MTMKETTRCAVAEALPGRDRLMEWRRTLSGQSVVLTNLLAKKRRQADGEHRRLARAVWGLRGLAEFLTRLDEALALEEKHED